MARPWLLLTEADVTTAKVLQAGGMSVYRIAKVIGRSKSTLRVRLRAEAMRDEIAASGVGRLVWSRTGIPRIVYTLEELK